jgi:hypothetical protein
MARPSGSETRWIQPSMSRHDPTRAMPSVRPFISQIWNLQSLVSPRQPRLYLVSPPLSETSISQRYHMSPLSEPLAQILFVDENKRRTYKIENISLTFEHFVPRLLPPGQECSSYVNVFDFVWGLVAENADCAFLQDGCYTVNVMVSQPRGLKSVETSLHGVTASWTQVC